MPRHRMRTDCRIWPVLILLEAATLACKPEVKGPTPVADAGPGPDAGTADSGSSTVDGSAADRASPDQGTVVTPGCNGECNALQATVCTCHVSDPCNWIGDGYCDTPYCLQVTSNPFDDSADCNSSNTCNGACARGEYTTCTCGASDPCDWAGDGTCDADCAQVLASGAFDDSADCGGPPPPPANACNGTCGNGAYDTCTCAASDPCGRAGNGTCDQSACAALLGAGAYNDSADCGGWDPTPAGDESFALTAVRDNLDSGDLDVVASGLPGLGFTQALRDDNVTTAELSTALGRSTTFHYHTGHGEPGMVITYDGAYDAGDSTIQIRHTVFATCLTLQSYAWLASMGESAQSLFGYTDVSLDYVDDEVAGDMVSALRNGKGYLQAWYLANAGQYSLSDRWAAYVREGASIVEYSARANQRPANTMALAPPSVALDPQGVVWALSALLADRRRFPAGVDATTGAAASVPRAREIATGGWSLLADGAGTAKRARDRARAFLLQQLASWPEGAELDRVTPVLSSRENGPARVAGHLVRFRRVLGGLPLRGNGVADHLSALIAGRGVVAWTVDWPQRQSEPVPEPTLDVASALRLAAPELALAAKGPLRIVGASAAWGVAAGSDSLLPAFALLTDSGLLVVVDARSGQLVR
ncbi:MAG: hypothetical protein JXR83_18715 [Deltaproteobacteria bacterium]|nr:hypothetical protein [Deltaproteobacteria bacterium]